jgi:hypothetical protein
MENKQYQKIKDFLLIILIQISLLIGLVMGVGIALIIK